MLFKTIDFRFILSQNLFNRKADLYFFVLLSIDYGFLNLLVLKPIDRYF